MIPFTFFRGQRKLVLSGPGRDRKSQPVRKTSCRPWLEALEDRVVPSQVPLTVTVDSVGALNNNSHNFHAAVTINGTSQNTPSQSGSSIFVDWPITQQVENTAGKVTVSIALFNGSNQMDLDPHSGDATIDISVDPTTGDYSGDLQFPNSFLQGDGSDGEAGNLSFTISVPNNASTSGDGIPDSWKTNGIPVGPGLPNYTLPGAVVGHHDLYVEADAMTGFAPISLPAITSITDAAGGPITVTTANVNALSTGNHVSIAGVGADTACDGNFTVTRINGTQFSLNNTTGKGNGTVTGSALNLAYSTTSTASGWWLTDIVNADNASPSPNLATGSDLDLVVNSFLNAPVTNSVGPNGVYLHIETDWTGLDGQIPAARWSTLDSSAWPTGFTTIQTNTSSTIAGGFGSPAERASPNATAILKAKASVYRYMIFGQNYGATSTSSGLSDLPGPDFMVTLGTFPITAETQAGTFMHEFGHTLGLAHGGEVAPMVGSLTSGSTKVTLPDTSKLYAGMSVSGLNLPGGNDSIVSVDSSTQITLSAAAASSGQSDLYFQDNINLKPNYQSVMNYDWQIPDSANAAMDASWQLNYSTQAFPTLNEASLTESAGIGGFAGLTEGILPTSTTSIPPTFSQFVLETGAVDWNGNGNTTDTGVSVDINNDGTIGTLVGYNDWPNLVYSFRDGYVYLNGNGGHASSADQDPTVPALTITGPGNQTAVEGASQSFSLGSFTAADAAPYSVDVSWGDSKPDTVFTAAAAGTITAQSHTYGEEGSYTATITVTNNGGQFISTTFGVTVSDPPVVAKGVAVSAVEGAAFSSTTIAQFTDPGGAEPNPSDPSGTINDHYKIVSIDWGDSTPLDTSSGAIAFSGAQGSTTDKFTVTGNHTYGEEGTYTITVVIDHEGVKTTTTATANVSDPAVVGTGTSFTAIACLPLTGVTVATFTDPGGAEPNPSDPSGTINDHYQVKSIDWGDGTPLDTTTGTLSYGGSPGSKTDPFTISGSHSYASEGVYTITVVIAHELATPTTVTSTATVKDNIGLLVLDPSGKGALTVSGNGGVIVNNCGAVVVNSTNAAAAILSGNGGVSAMDIDVTGGTSITGNGKSSGPIDHETPTPDPIALPLPPAPATVFSAVNYSGKTTLTLFPGTYVGGIKDSGQGNIVLMPGIYYLMGGGLQVSGNGSLSGAGVLIVNAPSKPADTISFSGQGNINLSAPLPASLPSAYTAYKGITLFQDPASTLPISITGNGGLTMDGALYAPKATLNISGNGGLTDSTDTTAPVAEVIVDDVNISGNANLTINADAAASNPPSNTPLPGAAQASFTLFTSSANPSVSGQSVTLAVTMTSVPVIAGGPTGSIDFFDQTTHLDLGSVTLVGGSATLTTSALMTLGDQMITATYFSASPNFAPPAAPAALTQHVQSEAIESGVLFVGGNPNSNNIQVSLNTGQVTVNLHDGSANFQTPLAGLTALVVYGQGNGEHIQVNNNLLLPAFLFAGNGTNVQIQGGGGPTVEVGGSGGGGHLQGGSGRNILIAGSGGGQLQGGNGGSILIGGSTDYDRNLTALEAALAEWSSADSYAIRTTSAALAIFNAATVHSDGLADQLQGGGGNAALDWFFASTLDQVTGKNPFDTVVAIT
jgi:hypothetical protein